MRFYTIRLDGGISDLISDPKRSIHGAAISPDGRWLAFHVPLTDLHYNLHVTPLHSGRAGADVEWIALTMDEYVNQTPWWSEDGNLLYFIYSITDNTANVWVGEARK